MIVDVQRRGEESSKDEGEQLDRGAEAQYIEGCHFLTNVCTPLLRPLYVRSFERVFFGGGGEEVVYGWER